MSRAAVQHQQQAFYGHQAVHGANMKQPGGRDLGGGGDGGSHPPSRLLQMRDEYQKKLMKEKEEKMVHMYEETTRRNVERAERLTRPHANGNSNAYPGSRLRQPGFSQAPAPQPHSPNPAPSVRDFFRERRELEAKGGYVPPIDHHYKQAKSRTGSGNSYYGNKNSAGVDRAQPLAPIQARPNGVSSAPSQEQLSPFNNKPRLVKHNNSTGNSATVDENENKVGKPYRNAGSGPPGPNPRQPAQQAKGGGPPPSDRGVRRDGGGGPKEEKLSDFEKWQMEQNKTREDRLKKLNQRAPPSGREGYEYEEEDEDEPVTARGRKSQRADDELTKQQRELMEKIAQQQAELDRLRQEREAEEEMKESNAQTERVEAEHLKKQQAAERERRKRQQQEEARQRREEEARIRKEEEAERKMTKTRQRNDDDDDDNNQPPSSRRTQPSKQPTPRQGGPTPPTAPAPQRRAPPQSRRPQPPPEPEEEEEDMIPVPGPGIDIYAAAEDNGPGGRVRLVPCKLCGRKFADDRIAKHQNACKVAQKKRKPLDPTKQRTEGTEMAKYVAKGTHKKEPPKKKKADWRQQHEEFINNIRYAKKVTHMEAQGLDTRDLAPPPPSSNPDLVPCPHCGRTFNITAAERHIPRCQDLKTKPTNKAAPNRRR